MGRITISNLRNIASLDFDVPSSGVYVLTGNNGCGKTSLLIALNRICVNTAFTVLKIGRSVGMDKFANTEITYTDGNQSVTYKRSNRGWEPSPRGVDVKSLFPFQECCFITTAGFRFYQPDTSTFYKRGRNVVYNDADQAIKDGLNSVFDTHKFDNLKYVTIRNLHGRQKKLHRQNIMYVIKENHNIYSEIHFSLGERLILNTLDFIQGLNNGGLLLVDEIELALHPTAQVRFYDHIKQIAQAKNLTCIISTHSSSLIKIADKRLYLESNGGTVRVLSDCQPAYILKDLTIPGDNRPDYIFFVEDEMAMRYLTNIIRKYQETEDRYVYFNVSYVGGYEQVVRLTEQFYRIQPFSRRQIQAFPDEDFNEAKNNLVAKPNKTPGEIEKLNLLNRNANNITVLDITPEKDVWDWLVNDPTIFMATIEQVYGHQMFSMANIVSQVVAEEINTQPNKPRAHAKFCFKNLVDKIKLQIPTTSNDMIFELLMRSYIEAKLSDHAELNMWKQRIKAIVNRH